MHYHHFYRQGYFLVHGTYPSSQEVQDYFAGNPKAEELITYAEIWYTTNPKYREVAWDILASAIANDLNLKDFI